MNRRLLKSIWLGTFLLTCLAPGRADAASLGTYNFPGPDPAGDTNTPSATNLTFTPFSAVNVVSASVPDLFRRTAWSTAGALNTAEYVQLTVKPTAGHTLTLTDITFDVRRSVDKASPGEKDGPLNGQIQVFQGVSLTLKGTQDFGPVGIWQNVVFDFTDFTTLDGETVTLRFYGWNAGHANGWLDLDSVTVNGSAAVVPEPSAAVFLSCGFLLLFARGALRRR
jgi:hypothetical protein